MGIATNAGQPGIAASVALEFAKARRKHLWLASLGLLAFQFAWLVAGASNTVRHNPDFDGILCRS